MANEPDIWKKELLVLLTKCTDTSSDRPTVISKLENALVALSKIQNHYTILDILNSVKSRQQNTSYLRHTCNLNELFIYLQSGFDTIHYFSTHCKNEAIAFKDILTQLKLFWIQKFHSKLIDVSSIDTIKRDLVHPNHFLQCNIEIVKQFISSIPKPCAYSAIDAFFRWFTNDVNQMSIADLESFLVKNTNSNLQICTEKLLVTICITSIHKKFGKSLLSSELQFNIERILKIWSVNDACYLMDSIQKEDDVTYLNSVLSIIVDYELLYDRRTFDLRNREQNSSKWPEIIHSYALNLSFSISNEELDLKKLVTETVKVNFDSDDRKEKEKARLLANYDKLSKQIQPYLSMTENQLKNNVDNIRNADYYSMVAFVIHVSNIIFKSEMRIVQKLSVLLALNSNGDCSRILQINTGEGKTRIIAVLAVIKALQGFKVDVITSSTELAQIQCKKLESFYIFFKLKVACNANLSDSDYIYGRRKKNGCLLAKIFEELGIFDPVYESNVIYGSADDFEADILRDEFDENGVRCGRKCEFAIVDEVDNMMIDGRQHMLRLSSPVPSVFYLLPVKAIIWNQILNLSKIVTKRNGIWYKLCEDENQNIVTELLNESILGFAKRIILPLLQQILHLDNNNSNELNKKLLIPKHLEKFTSDKLTRWIENAAYAKFEMKEGYEYILEGNKIVYVDVENTGVLHDTMRWNDGLHCFLEMKHDCSMEPEHITTNFMSHVTFFLRYGTNLIGLTGTVGGETSRSMFRDIYSADCLIIPPFRERRHFELRPLFANSERDWLESVIRSCSEKMKQKQAVLVITKFIKEAKQISDQFCSNFPGKSIKLYTNSEEKSVVSETLQAGCAIVATNIAGRGTDILVSDEVEQNGGLHVCITFLPDNDRVEMQNQGRTSRTGNKGTSQFIINLSDTSQFINYHMTNERELLNEIRKHRDMIQSRTMTSAMQSVRKIILKDKIFLQFSDIQKAIIEKFSDDKKDGAKKALREKFGLWLIASDSEEIECLQTSFENFISDCQLNPESRLIDNPMYYIQIANTHLKKQANLSTAIELLNTAIDMDPGFLASAYYSRAYARALQYKKSNNTFFLEKSIEDFKRSRVIINDVLDSTIMLFPVASNTSPLHEFLVHLKTLHGTLINSINSAVGRSLDEELTNLESQLDDPTLDTSKKQKLKEYLQHLQTNKDELENGVLGNALKSNREIKVEYKTLAESLPSSEKKDLYKKEIEQFETNGFIGIIIFNERKPIQWWSVISVGLIGLGQAIAGVSLAVFSAGAGTGLGFSLLQEGLSDLVTCVKNGIINRDFSWKQWGIQKAVSLAITIACAGFSALKAAARTAKDAAITVKNAVTYGAKELWTKSVKEGIKIGGKLFAVEAVKRATIELTVPLVNYTLSATILPVVQEIIQNRVNELFKLNYENNQNLRCLMDCDAKQRNRYCANKLEETIFSQLNKNNFKQMCTSIGTQLLNRKLSGVASTAITAMTVATRLEPIVKALSTIVSIFNSEIDKLAESSEVKAILSDANYSKQQQQNAFNYIESSERQADSEKLSLTIEEFCIHISEKISKMICQLLQDTFVPPLVGIGVNNILFSTINNDINNQLDLFHKKRTAVYHRQLTQSEIKEKVTPKTLAAAKDEIQKLEQGGLGGIHHIGYLADITDRRVLIYDQNGRVEQVIGNDTSQPPIELVYIPPSTSNDIGHWTTPRGDSVQNTQG